MLAVLPLTLHPLEELRQAGTTEVPETTQPHAANRRNRRRAIE